MHAGLKEFDNLVQTLLRNKLQNLGYQFKSQDEFDEFIRDKIYIHIPEQSNLQHFYLGKPNKNGILLLTYKMQ